MNIEEYSEEILIALQIINHIVLLELEYESSILAESQSKLEELLQKLSWPWMEQRLLKIKPSKNMFTQSIRSMKSMKLTMQRSKLMFTKKSSKLSGNI